MAVKKIKDSNGTEHVIDATLWNSYESPEAMGLLSGVKNITYSDLVTLRNNSNLAPGQQYRITDYVTTTVQDNTQSAGHLFDIIVTALSNNTLDEEAYAMCSERDTDNYFGTSELNAWKLWYCLDNDRERFGWADTTNGKGVIYRMIDEFNNDCPYDFKNIKYYHNGMGTYVYTFTWIDENYNVMDSSVFGNNGTLTFNGKIYGVCNNVIKPYYIISDTPDEHTGDYVRRQCLNNIVFISDYSYQGNGNDGFCGCNNNSFGNECYKNSFGNYCYANSFGNYCYNNSFGNYCCSNSFRNECYANTFGNNCDYNSFGNDCNYNSFGNECQYNTFGNNSDYNSFGNKCYKNSFVNNCNNNSFGNNCCYNTFGNNCYKNSFVDECYSNSFGNECYSNSFGNDCRYNSFGNDCRYNSFGNSCRNNLFGNYCYANSFVNECCSNSFGNYCYANVFGNYCCSNSFGNECYRNSFRLSASTSGTLLDYCHYNKFDDGCTYNVIWNDGTTSSGFPLQNININRGVSGTSRSYNMINIDTLNADYETKVDNVNGYIYILKGPENIYKTTYSNLISIRDNSQLIPGLQYRITDYITTTIQENTTSAGHQFDIIVTALDESTLSEEAKAIQHDGDTYFNTANLSAWQLWYCLDNDDTRFRWADTTNGKGVIYRMIDEYNNECPYDFKNIMFKKYLYYDEENSYCWKTIRDIEGEEGDFSDNEYITVKSAFCYTFTYCIGGNTISDLSIVGNNSLYSETDCIPGVKDNIIKKCLCYFYMDRYQRLNNIVFFVDQTDDWFVGVLNNTCGYNCRDIYLNGSNGYFGNNNHIGNGCYDIYFGGDNDNNNFGDVCEKISIGSYSNRNSFGNNCSNIYIGENCAANSFGNTCSAIQIGNVCRFNKFENRCVSIRFGSNCIQNSFGNNCSQIYFGQTASKLKSNYRNIIIDNGNCNIYLNCTSTTSSSKNYQNVRIGLGVNNTSTYKTISDSNVNQTYETLYLPKNSQTITI